MKTIEVDDELYHYIARQTRHIGESASDILRRLLNLKPKKEIEALTTNQTELKTDYRVLYLTDQLVDGNILTLKKTIDRFISLLSILYSIDNQKFEEAAQSIAGRTRIYFAKDKQILLQHGKQSKPKSIPNTPFWVITNTNSARKATIIADIMKKMALPATLIDKAVKIIISETESTSL